MDGTERDETTSTSEVSDSGSGISFQKSGSELIECKLLKKCKLVSLKTSFLWKVEG